MSAVATNPEMLVAPNASGNAPKVVFRPVSSIAHFRPARKMKQMLRSNSRTCTNTIKAIVCTQKRPEMPRYLSTRMTVIFNAENVCLFDQNRGKSSTHTRNPDAKCYRTFYPLISRPLDTLGTVLKPESRAQGSKLAKPAGRGP